MPVARYICFLILALTVCVGAIAESHGTTAQFLNGRAWKSLTADAKLAYVVGLSEAPLLCDTASPRNLYAFNEVMTRLEIVQAIDQFYADPSNTAVLIAASYRYLALKSQGTPPDALERELARMRKAAHDLSQP